MRDVFSFILKGPPVCPAPHQVHLVLVNLPSLSHISVSDRARAVIMKYVMSVSQRASHHTDSIFVFKTPPTSHVGCVGKRRRAAAFFHISA